MEDLTQAQDHWFYAEGEEKIGPVSFAFLKTKAEAGQLNPRHVMVWTVGMETWVAAGEIPELFERRGDAEGTDAEIPKAKGEPLAVNPYAAPETARDLMAQHTNWPGVTRRGYILAVCFFPGLWSFVTEMLSPFLSSQVGPQIFGFLMIGLALVPLILSISFGLKRLTNLGMSRWWYLGLLVPFLNFWVGYRSFACPAGYAYHLKIDGWGIVLAIIYWLLVLLILVVIAVIIAVLFGDAGSPEIREQLQGVMAEFEKRAQQP